jgi:N4-gp56 family major capsid protein
LAFQTLSGVTYAKKPNGAMRTGSDFPFLEFAADVSAPSNARRVRWNGTNKTLATGADGVSGNVATADTPMWEMFVQLKAYAKERYMRGVGGEGGEENFHAFLTPTAMAKLKLDPTYMQNLRHAQTRASGNPLFTGSSVTIDGITLHEFRHVCNTSGAASGSKYGGAGTVDGCQILFCGAQSLGMADIGSPYWDEEGFDYSNQQGISVGKILGFLKPKFGNIYEGGAVEDFGVISAYVAV